MKKFINTTSKYGYQEVLIDDEDAYLLEDYGWYLFSTPRHHGIYVCFSRSKANGEFAKLNFPEEKI